MRRHYNFCGMPSIEPWPALALSALALTPLAAPLLAGSHPLAALLIRSFFSRLCHQIPARSFLVSGSPVAVCVRCLGIYWGAAGAALVRPELTHPRWLLTGALLLNLLDVVGGMFHWYGNLPVLRLGFGLWLGFATGAVLFIRQTRWSV